MNRPPITPKRILITLGVLLLISSQLPARVAAVVSHVPRKFVRYLVYPAGVLQRASTTLRPPQADRADFSAGGGLDQQLEEAKVYISSLEQEVRELRQINESLDVTGQFLNLGGITRVPCNVIAFNGDRKNPVLTVGIGSDDGVRKGLAVVWSASLVGEVQDVSASTSDVRLITAVGTKLQVRISKPTANESAVPLDAFIQLSDDGQTFFTNEFSLDAPVAVGDLVHLADEGWQYRARGFIVGKVVAAQPFESRPFLNKHVVIRPMLPLISLTRVTVLVPVD